MNPITRKDFLMTAVGAAAAASQAARSGAPSPAPSPSPDPEASVAPDLVLRDLTVLTMDAQRRCYRSGYVWMRAGRIHAVGPAASLGAVPEAVPVRSLPGHVALPGLVNGHTHLSNAILRGLYDEMPLAVWFSKGMWPVLAALDREAAAAGTALALLEQMAQGVTTVAAGDFGTPRPDMIEGVLASVTRAGVRAVVSRITVDGADEDAANRIPPEVRETPSFAEAEVKRLRATFGNERIRVVPEALGVLRCTPRMVQGMHDLAGRLGAPFLMHAASSPDEDRRSRARFGHGTVAELARLGVLGPRTLLAHAIWLADEEIALLARHGTGVSHNPVSNAYYASGVARLKELLAAGVRVGLGTDGATTNNGQNLWETAKMALLFQKQRTGEAGFGSAELALELLTIGGARALHLEDEIGSLEAGKRADLVVLDARRPSLVPRETLVSNLIYAADPAAVRSVFVDGEEVVREGVHRRLEAAAVVEAAGEAARRVLDRAGLSEYLETRGRFRFEG
jgi:5-methylthioadenosine/S-adenosylhomocysteine deaminase